MATYTFNVRKYSNTRAQDKGHRPKSVTRETITAKSAGEAWDKITRKFPANRAHAIEQVIQNV